jgi:phosphatidylserine decarboxylase
MTTLKKSSGIAREGWPFIAVFGLGGAVACLAGGRVALLLGLPCLFLGLACACFFRDPERVCPATADILSPADGRVLEVAAIDGEGYGDGKVVRIFLSILDVHIQRAPLAGEILSVRHTPGRLLCANHRRAHLVNENTLFELQASRGRLAVRSIAGFVARRVVSWVPQGAQVETGQRLGMIRFGSQVDVYVPADVEILVRVGERVRAGLTSVGRWPR